METLVLCELPADDGGTREALLARIGRLGLAGRAKLSFVGHGQTAVVVAVGFSTLAEAERFAAASSGEGRGLGTARLLRLDPVWQAEPLPLLFP